MISLRLMSQVPGDFSVILEAEQTSYLVASVKIILTEAAMCHEIRLYFLSRYCFIRFIFINVMVSCFFNLT